MITLHSSIAAFANVVDTSVLHDETQDAKLPDGTDVFVQREYNLDGEDSFHLFLPDGRVISSTVTRPTVEQIAEVLGSPKSFAAKNVPITQPESTVRTNVTPGIRSGAFKLPSLVHKETKKYPVTEPTATIKPTKKPDVVTEELDLMPLGVTPLFTPPIEERATEPPTPSPLLVEPEMPPWVGPPPQETILPIATAEGVEPEIELPTRAESAQLPIRPRALTQDAESDDVLRDLLAAARWHQVHSDWYLKLSDSTPETAHFRKEARTHERYCRSLKLAADRLRGRV